MVLMVGAVIVLEHRSVGRLKMSHRRGCPRGIDPWPLSERHQQVPRALGEPTAHNIIQLLPPRREAIFQKKQKLVHPTLLLLCCVDAGRPVVRPTRPERRAR